MEYCTRCLTHGLYEKLTHTWRLYHHIDVSSQTTVWRLKCSSSFKRFWNLPWDPSGSGAVLSLFMVFFIPPCHLRGFCVQLVFWTFTGCISWSFTALTETAVLSSQSCLLKVTSEFHYLWSLEYEHPITNSRYLICPDLRAVINNLCRVK